MRHQILVFLVIYLTSIVKDVSSWSISIKPESGHIRVNKTTTIMCRTIAAIYDCKFKIDSRKTLEFRQGRSTSKFVVKHKGRPLYTAQYSGSGLEHGQCGLTLSNVAAGVYVVGCQLRDSKGSERKDFMTLTVDNNQPLRVKVNRKYQVAAPGSDVAVLCRTEKKQPLDHCAMRLPSSEWVLLQQGHQSRETDHYHYHGRGLEKGHCGVNLLNVTEGDSGVVLCHVKVGAKNAVRAVILKVAKLKPETEISWDAKPNLAPGDVLAAECVMKGAYPLPAMVWHFDSKVLQQSEADETPLIEATFRWPWEDHIIRQKVVVPVGTKLGMKTLKCSPAEAAQVSESEVPVATKYLQHSNNEISVPVHPKCGMRTSSKYDTAYKSKKPITKRDTKPIAGTLSQSISKPEKPVIVVSEDQSPTRLLEPSHPASRTTTGRPPRGTTTGDDADYVEPVWDETELELAPQRPPIQSFEGHHVFGMAGAQTVLWQEPPKFERLPSVAIPPAPIAGGNQLLVAYRDPAKYRNYTGIFTGEEDHPVLQSLGGTEVFRAPEVHYSVGGKTVFNVTDTNVEFVTYPWTAGVYKNIKGKYSQQCGGTLVTDTHVICAAHCFWNEGQSKPIPPDDYMVALGKVFREWDTFDAMVQKRAVRQLHIHPVFRGRKRNFQHDISVIELGESVDFSPRVAPACVDWDNDFEDQQLSDGNSGVVTGWGYTEDEKPSEVLRFVELPYVDVNTCYDQLPEDMQLLLTTDKFCAGFSNRNTSVCPGDSGGGLLFRDPEYDAYFLRGVVSVSFRPPAFVGKCYYSEVTGFTMVSQSLPWLKRILKHKI